MPRITYRDEEDFMNWEARMRGTYGHLEGYKISYPYTWGPYGIVEEYKSEDSPAKVKADKERQAALYKAAGEVIGIGNKKNERAIFPKEQQRRTPKSKENPKKISLLRLIFRAIAWWFFISVAYHLAIHYFGEQWPQDIYSNLAHFAKM